MGQHMSRRAQSHISRHGAASKNKRTESYKQAWGSTQEIRAQSLKRSSGLCTWQVTGGVGTKNTGRSGRAKAV
eukprot:1161518-Pelagomonas_calceolata.AAC.17